MAIIIDGKELAKNIREGLKEEVNELKNAEINPKLAVIMVGDDKASKVYVKNKSKACEDVGIEYEEYLLPTKTKMEELLELIEKLNNDETIHGILVQSPLPEGLDANEAFKTISPKKDVDGFNPINVGKIQYRNRRCKCSDNRKKQHSWKATCKMFIKQKCNSNSMSLKNKKLRRYYKTSRHTNSSDRKSKICNTRHGKKRCNCNRCRDKQNRKRISRGH